MKAETAALAVEFVQRLHATRRGARQARHLTLQWLDHWGFPYGSEVSDAAAVTVAELATNAVTHGRVPGREFELRLVLRSAALRIEVSDARTDRRPSVEVSAPDLDLEAGRGLFLVAALATAWGVADREPVGKTIWAEIAVPL